MKEFYNGGFAPEFSVSLLKETNSGANKMAVLNKTDMEKVG